MPSSKPYFVGLTRGAFLLAVGSLFADVSTEMLYPVLPIFLTQELGASPALVGIIEGVAPALQNVAQGISGWVSDRLRRHKGIALLGYSLAAFAKPIIGLSTSWLGVLVARSLDRIGAGTRSAPRDALVAGSVDDADRGKAFGLEGFGDNLGAFLGPLLAILLLDVFHAPLRWIFFLSFFPGVLAAFSVLSVPESPPREASPKPRERDGRKLPGGYLRTLVAVGVFGLGNSSTSFLILRTKALGASLTTTILVYAGFNLVAALISYPVGWVSDRLGRKVLLLLSFLVFFVVYAGVGLTENAFVIAPLFVLYGLHQGTFRAIGKALVTDLVPAELHATGIGWYTTTVGLTGLVASVAGGELWTRVGPSATFLFGAGTALVGILLAVVLIPGRRGFSSFT
ncbi:MAG TPA: MFS transporter [Polyangiaceae bacterium]|nr:MFS transporter [Polyangiaceae bacterium]